MPFLPVLLQACAEFLTQQNDFKGVLQRRINQDVGLNATHIKETLKRLNIFVQQKAWTLLALKRHSSFQNKNNRKALHSFVSRPLIFKLQQEVSKFNEICVS